MSETKTLHKRFWVWEFEKEERWLNQMAQEGWALQNAGFSTYTFERCEPGEYIIRMAMLNDSAGAGRLGVAERRFLHLHL